MYDKICNHCKKPFVANRKDKVFCSQSCKIADWNKKQLVKAKQFDEISQTVLVLQEASSVGTVQEKKPTKNGLKKRYSFEPFHNYSMKHPERMKSIGLCGIGLTEVQLEYLVNLSEEQYTELYHKTKGMDIYEYLNEQGIQ
jgi:hypothetical protein